MKNLSFYPKLFSKFRLLLVLIIVQTQSLPGQDIAQILQSSDTSFYHIYDRLDNYYTNNSNNNLLNSNEEEVSDNEEINQFYKWAQFWQNRMDVNGMIESAPTKMGTFIGNDITFCETDNDKDIDWRELGPFNSSGARENNGSVDCANFIDGHQNQGRIESISVHTTDPNHIVAGGANGGIWRSIDGGANWTNVTDDEGFSIVGVTDLVRHPADPSIIYAATGSTMGMWDLYSHAYGIGVLVSKDNGVSWSITGLNTNYGRSGKVLALAIAPNSTLSNTIVYASTSQRLYKWQGNTSASDDWIEIYTNTSGSPYQVGGVSINDVEVEADGTTWFCHRDGIFRIPANSTTANLVDNYTIPAAVDITTTCADPNPLIRKMSIDINRQGHVVFIVKYYFFDSNCDLQINPYIYRTTDSGLTWEGGINELGIFPSGAIRFAISRDNSNVLYAEQQNGARCVSKSTDFGQTFTLMNSGENHVDVRYLYTYDGVPNDPNGDQDILYVGTDGGLSIATDGFNWVDITGEGMACTNNYGVGITEANSDFIFTGAQDGSINFYNEGEWFETLPGGDNGEVLIDPNMMTRVYQQSQSSLRRTTVTGSNTNWGDVITPPGPNGYLYPMLFNPNDPNEIFAAKRTVEGSQNNGDTWNTVSDNSLHPDNRISSLAMSANNSDILYYTVSGYWWNSNNPVSSNSSYFGGVFRANRAGGNWVVTDITNNLNFKCANGECGLGAPISDIAVDPDDENNIWVTLGSFSDGNKVYHTTDGGTTWVNKSNCLPNIPFSSIVYQGGTNNRVYAGSDFGVFYKDDSMTDWAFYGNGGPKTLVADMEINRCGNKLVVATQGRGLWEVDLINDDPITLGTGTTDWITPRILSSDIIVPTGATLNITGTTINIAKNVKIIVEEGAYMIVDNSTLTNGCGEFWKGIEVWGDASQNQYNFGGSYHQGRLMVRNNSIIEYARNAVKLGKEGDLEMQYTGGFIRASNSIFKNNIRAIEFLKYRNFHPFQSSFTLDNRSFFRECHFITDEDLPENKNPYAFVTMWEVDNVHFYSCDFENINPNASTSNELGKGIYTEDASFKVLGCTNNDDICPFFAPCCNPNKSIFRNLQYGVHATADNSTRNFIVDAAYFENCRWAVTFEEIDYARITRSDFVMGYTLDGSETYAVGIHDSYGTQYRIEENTFSRSTDASSNTLGILIWHAGEENNEIYRNTFENMTYANLAVGSNGSITANPDGSFDGLIYNCNNQVNSESYDMNSFWGNGIRHYQGGFSSSGNYITAANTFTNSGSNSESDISNASIMNIMYIHGNGVNEEPLFFTPFKVLPISPQNLQNHTCPNRFAPVLEDDNESSVKFTEAQDQLNLLQEKYVGKIDNNDTNGLVNQILQSGTNDQGLKAILLDASPYLSTTILNTIIENQKFTDHDLVEILNANPDALRQTDIIKQLTSQSTLSTAFMTQLETGKGIITERGELEMGITYYKAEKERFAVDIIRDLMNKADDEKKEEDALNILTWMQTFQTLPTNYAIIDYLFNKGQLNEAMNLFTSIPNTFSLSHDQSLEYQDLNELYTILVQVEHDNRNEWLLKEDEYNTINTMADLGHGKSQIKAQNIMRFFYNKQYPFELNLPESSGDREDQELDDSINKRLDKVSLELFPNPANEELHVRYLSPSIYGNSGKILIINHLGQEFFYGVIDAQEKDFLIRVQDWNKGMYYCIYKPTKNTQKVIPFVISN